MQQYKVAAEEVIDQLLWKESLNSDGKKFHKYQHNEQYHLLQTV